MGTPIGTLGTIPTLTVGGRVFTDLTNLFFLGGHTGANNNVTFRNNNTSAGYQVTTGKTLTISAIKAVAASALSATATAFQATLVYSDNDVGLNSVTAFTNQVTAYGSLSVAQMSIASGPGSGEIVENGTIKFTVPALKYPGAVTSTTATIAFFVFGYET